MNNDQNILSSEISSSNIFDTILDESSLFKNLETSNMSFSFEPIEFYDLKINNILADDLKNKIIDTETQINNIITSHNSTIMKLKYTHDSLNSCTSNIRRTLINRNRRKNMDDLLSFRDCLKKKYLSEGKKISTDAIISIRKLTDEINEYYKIIKILTV